jgi:hypothetical protein
MVETVTSIHLWRLLFKSCQTKPVLVIAKSPQSGALGGHPKLQAESVWPWTGRLAMASLLNHTKRRKYVFQAKETRTKLMDSAQAVCAAPNFCQDR